MRNAARDLAGPMRDSVDSLIAVNLPRAGEAQFQYGNQGSRELHRRESRPHSSLGSTIHGHHTEVRSGADAVHRPRVARRRLLGGAGLTYDDTLLVYENNALPGRAYVMLEYIGFGGRIHVLDGGIRAWGGGLSKAAVKVAPSDFRLTRKSDPRVDKAYVAGKVGAADVAIIDCRDEPAYVDGHIPGARNLPQSTLMTKQGTLQPAEEVTRLFRGAGVDGSKPVISYCGSGVYGANTFLAMRNLGYRSIVLYDGSWDEWSRDPNARQDSSLANYTIDSAGFKPAKSGPRFVDRKELQTAIDANRKLLSEADLGAMYAKAGLSPDKRVIIYARGGYQLTHTYTVLSMLGYKDVDFYNGKFEGWKAK